MILTSGTLVMPGADQSSAPTLDDIAVGLCRAPRFGGHTVRWWPVLLHSIVCYRMAAEMYSRWGQMEGTQLHQTLMHALMHDAHETVLSDVPKTWKPMEMDAMGITLDERIFAGLGVRFPSSDVRRWVKAIDIQALSAEADQFGPPGITEHESIPAPSSGAIDIVAGVGDAFRVCNGQGLNVAAIQHFKETFHSLKASVAG